MLTIEIKRKSRIVKYQKAKELSENENKDYSQTLDALEAKDNARISIIVYTFS